MIYIFNLSIFNNKYFEHLPCLIVFLGLDGKKLLCRDAKNGDNLLSVVFSDEEGERQFAHYRIAKDETGMHYLSESKRFTSVRQLIDYYNNQQSGLVARLGIWFKGNQSKATKKVSHPRWKNKITFP